MNLRRALELSLRSIQVMPDVARIYNCHLMAFNWLIPHRGLSSLQIAHPVSLMFCSFIQLQACSIIPLLRILSRSAGGNSELEDSTDLGSKASGRDLDFASKCLCHLSVGVLGFASLLINTVLFCMQHNSLWYCNHNCMSNRLSLSHRKHCDTSWATELAK